MNDDPLSPELLASAYLDDELTPEERARVEADPSLSALVAAYAAVRDAVAAPVSPLPEDQRNALVAAALSAAPAGGATVIPLAPRRERRWLRVAAGAAAAAAAVAVIGLIVHAASQRTGPGAGTAEQGTLSARASAAQDASAAGGAASTPEAPGTEAASAAAVAPPANGATPAPSSLAPSPEAAAATSAADSGRTTAASALEDLGTLGNRTEFIAAARPFKATPSAPGAGPCPSYPPPLATATFQGTPAYLVVLEATPAGNRVALVATDTCAVLVKADLSAP